MRYDDLLEFFSPLLNNPTSIISLHKEANFYFKENNLAQAKKIEKLINILLNKLRNFEFLKTI